MKPIKVILALLAILTTAGVFVVLSGLSGLAVLAGLFFFAVSTYDPRPMPPELNLASPISMDESYFYEVGPATEFRQLATDEAGRNYVLGRTDRGNGVSWIAEWTDAGALSAPVILSEDAYKVPDPEVFDVAFEQAAYVENVARAVDKDSDKVFDATVFERERHYRFAPRWYYFHETRAAIEFVSLNTGQVVRTTPFGPLDARFTSISKSEDGFVAGGYVVPDGQSASYPALFHAGVNGANPIKLVFQEGFSNGSHWIEDVHPIGSDRFLVAGTTVAAERRFTGWLAIVDVVSGELTRIGEPFLSDGNVMIEPAESGHHYLITETQVLRVDENGRLIWELSYDTARGTSKFDQYIPIATAKTNDDGIWIAGTVAGGEWVAWLAKISSTGEPLSWSYWGSYSNAERLVGIMPNNSSGGVKAFGTVFCKFGVNCGSGFANGFVIDVPMSGGLNRETLNAFVDFAKVDKLPQGVLENDIKLCTHIDVVICEAVEEIAF